MRVGLRRSFKKAEYLLDCGRSLPKYAHTHHNEEYACHHLQVLGGNVTGNEVLVKRYSDEFKEQILAECREVGNVSLVARRHEISENTIYTWISNRR